MRLPDISEFFTYLGATLIGLGFVAGIITLDSLEEVPWNIFHAALMASIGLSLGLIGLLIGLYKNKNVPQRKL